MEALVEAVGNIRRRVKWGFVVHTIALFLFLTTHTAMNLDLLSTGYVDNRSFPRAGPIGYIQVAYFSTALLVFYSGVFFPLGQWLADGLLVSRSISDSLTYAPHATHSSSYIVAMSFIP